MTSVIYSTKPTEFADNNFRSDGNGINFSYRPEHTLGKGEIPRSERFHLSRSVFQRLTLQTLENWGLFVKGLIATSNLELLRVRC